MEIKEVIKSLEEKKITLWKEGESLKFKAPKGVITAEVREMIKNNKQELLRYLEENTDIDLVEDKKSRYERFPLTDIQNSYVLGRNNFFELGGVGCHGYLEVKYDEVLEQNKIEKAWNKVIKKHDMLRAIVSDTGYQIVQEAVPEVKVKYVNANVDGAELKAEIRDEFANKQYKLGQWPMCDLAVSVNEKSSTVHFSLDMLIADFISMNVILNDLEYYYKNIGEAIVYPSKYRDIVMHQNKVKNNNKRELAERYWDNKLDEIGEAPNLPIVKTKELDSSEFYQEKMFLDDLKWEKFCEIAKKNNVTSATLVLSALAEVVSYWSKTNKFSINTTFFNRPNICEDINEVVGDFTDVNVTAINLNKEQVYLDRIKEIHNNLWTDLEYNEFSGVEVLRKLTKERKHNVIIPVVFTSTAGIARKDDVMLKREIEYKISQTPQVYIDCQLSDENNGAKINWDVREGVFNKKMIRDMFKSFSQIIEDLYTDSAKVLSEKNPIRLPQESLEMRRQINNTTVNYQAKRLEEGFLETLKNHPDKTAVIDKDGMYTYKQLGKYVASILEILEIEKIEKGHRIGINIDKGVWQIAAVLATLIKDNAYVPIDVDQPLMRKQKIIKSAEIKVVLSLNNEFENNIEFKNINLKEIELFNGEIELKQESKELNREAYIIFTSGTTGEPKGVVITHEAAINTIINITDKYKIEKSDVFLGLANLSFDLSVYDIFGCFNVGGTLVLPESKNTRDPKYIYDLILLHRVSIWNSVPAQMQLIISYLESIEDIKRSESISKVFLSGDWIPVNLPRRIYDIFPKVKVTSLGGATEASIWSIYYDIKKDEDFINSIPYGVPMANQKMYVLNENLENLPDYVEGNIYIGGKGLSKGYLGDEELNKEKYVFSEEVGERIYRTGDVGFYREDGNIIFKGREQGDNQVKVHGHRIELNEIKSVLVENPMVDSATVLAVKSNQGDIQINSVVTPKKKRIKDVYVKDIEEDKLLRNLENRYEEEIDGELLKKWTRCSELVVLGDIIDVFRKHDLFVSPKIKHSFQEIISKIEVLEKYFKLLNRWLFVLEKENIIGKENDKYYLLENEINLDTEKLWDDFYTVESDFKYSKDFLDYLRASSKALLELLNGKEDPLNLLFPKGDVRPAMASYHDNKVNMMNNNFIANDIVYLSKKNIDEKPNRKFRILEVGAGVGGTTIDLIPKLDGLNVEYYFTDLSTFFLNKAKENFKGYDWIKYGIFDINTAFEKQNFEAFSFDLILCANVIHNSKDVHWVMENLKGLLVDEGTLVVLEETRLSYMLLTSMEFKEGLTGFLDERAEKEQTFFMRKQWENIFNRHNAELVYEFPNKESVLDLSGQTVYIARFKNEFCDLNKEIVEKYLEKSISRYMMPNNILVIPKLPLTKNKKVDEKYLKTLFELKENLFEVKVNKDTPNTNIEKKMAEIWCRELNLKTIGVNDDFYSVGGDSLIIAQIVGKIVEEIEEAKNWEWSSLLTEMMQTPTIRELSTKIENRNNKIDECIEPSLVKIKESNTNKEESIVKVLFHAGTGTLSAYVELIDYIKEDSKENEEVLGFSFGNEVEYISMKTEDTFKILGKKYGEILRKLDYSKYILVGHCVGGLIALEVAEYLNKAECIVSDVTLISTTIPREKSTTEFNLIEDFKYKKALETSLKNELLLERTFSRLINGNIFKAGHLIKEERLDECIHNIVNNRDGDLSIESFINLKGEYNDVSENFKKLVETPISERLNKLYLSIQRENMNLLEHEEKMLNTLFNIFSQNFGCVATHEPKKYESSIRIFSCEKQEESFYKEFFGEDYETWKPYTTDNAIYDTVVGQHFDCLSGENLKRNVKKILKFNY